MQVDIKTTSVVQLRETFSHVARHLGSDKPASRYQEASLNLQSTANFHYRPLWEPERELYDVRRTQIEMKDWYAFKDPRQYYYGSYTIVRSRQQETMEKSLEFVDKRGLLRDLPQEIRNAVIFALVPMRHLEWGANLNNCFVTAYGYGTAITQATMFHGMDRLGLAQYLSRIGLLLDGNSGESLAHAKTLWMEHAAWQPLRRLMERMMICRDWFELFVKQNLVLDGLLHPLVFRQFEPRISAQHGPALSLLTEFMTTWFDESSRWVDATIKTAAAESPANAERLRGWIAESHSEIMEALGAYAAELFGEDAAGALAKVEATLEARLTKLGVGSTGKAS
ncbi:phenol 2-monooxygenase P1 subunit [Panacagrimonas perspica]|uniref:Phenol 2-monooxygenase P1 subunit n=1 Tax=Panacagrimonas perspica TaxID=381431 RepID=A0A4S3KC72_9GAMM|nr:aromatic/alkene monooxygenase hydroxylase subunit beta [Panacagrimonas perspica]TDU32600.1 phenol 2-monooxygenase P1 subunit [Panacagrimonas perspica]THD05494.1 phenol hydroxylase [Panacagrimonas perspica]